MKKTMKKTLILILLAVICLSMILSTVAIAFAEEIETDNLTDRLLVSGDTAEEKIYTNKDGKIVVDGGFPYEFWIEFETKFKDRTSGTAKELEAAKFLEEQFVELGLTTYNGSYFQNFSEYSDSGDGSGTLLNSQNVVGVQKSKNASGKQVIIGAHYDNSHLLLDNARSEGAYDNASGIVSVLTVAKVLQDFQFDFDIVYVMFGMEERGLFGSEAFVNKMSETEKANTLLMINFDSTVCGDYLYAYTDELPRIHEDIFFESDKNSNVNALRKYPTDKRAFLVDGEDSFFMHTGQMSDNYPFLKAKINSISFSGYNLESKTVVGGIEKEGENDIMHTTNDNVEKILRLYGKDFVTKRFSDSTSIVLTTLIRDDFQNVMVESKNNSKIPYFVYSKTFAGIVYGVVLLAFIGIIFIIINKLKKETIEKTGKDDNTIMREDIFKTFEDFNKAAPNEPNSTNKQDDNEDIFGL